MVMKFYIIRYKNGIIIRIQRAEGVMHGWKFFLGIQGRHYYNAQPSTDNHY